MGSRGPQRPLVVMLAMAVMLVLPVMLAAAPKPAVTPVPDQSPTPTPVPIHIKSMRFDPNPLTIVVGQTVQFTNDDKVQHTATDINGVWDSGTIEPGTSWQQTFVKPGTYEFLCGFHPTMRSRIIVTSLSSATFTPKPAFTSAPAPTPSAGPFRNPPSD